MSHHELEIKVGNESDGIGMCKHHESEEVRCGNRPGSRLRVLRVLLLFLPSSLSFAASSSCLSTRLLSVLSLSLSSEWGCDSSGCSDCQRCVEKIARLLLCYPLRHAQAIRSELNKTKIYSYLNLFYTE